ncbi:MAG TPA: hypothetical protein VNB06_14025 [Thermoanaerobaculia bacterium]|nr:hypothetical protein [Thermoanaerobaculia bacterium]
MRVNGYDTRRLCGLALVWIAGIAPVGAAGGVAVPVSPGARGEGAVVEARCPTFSWSGVAGARGYELAVFRVSEGDGEDPTLVSRPSLPADARSFTPPLDRCLERGARYAWSVAATAEDAASGGLDWAPALLFAVEATPSMAEVEAAAALLRRYLDSAAVPDGGGNAIDAAGAVAGAPARPRTVDRDSPRPVPANPQPGVGSRTRSEASSPTLGSASLTVSNQIHLGTASPFFVADKLFLWSDGSGNTSLGRDALSSAHAFSRGNTALGWTALQSTGTGAANLQADFNVAVGYQALYKNTIGHRNTAVGTAAMKENLTGNLNTAIGVGALNDNTEGSHNNAIGWLALRSNSTGAHNTAIGVKSLDRVTTGSNNVALGYYAGQLTAVTSSNNILINNTGAGEQNTLRIGQGTGTGARNLNKAFIYGIDGKTPGPDAATVQIGTNGQLGVQASSRRVKQEIESTPTRRPSSG